MGRSGLAARATTSTGSASSLAVSRPTTSSSRLSGSQASTTHRLPAARSPSRRGAFRRVTVTAQPQSLASVSQSSASRAAGGSHPPVPHTRSAGASSVSDATRSIGSRTSAIPVSHHLGEALPQLRGHDRG